MDDTDEAASGFKNRDEYEEWKAAKIKENQANRSSRNDNSTYYQILGLTSSASKEEIKQAYKDLLNVWNPERFNDDPQLKEKASAKIKEIDEAYEKLLVHLVAASSTPQPVQSVLEAASPMNHTITHETGEGNVNQSVKKQQSLGSGAISVALFVVGGLLAKLFGIYLLILFLGTAAALVARHKTSHRTKGVVIPAFAVQCGHGLWMLSALILLGNVMESHWQKFCY